MKYLFLLIQTIEDEEDVVYRKRTDQINDEPGSDVVLGNKFKIKDHRLSLILQNHT